MNPELLIADLVQKLNRGLIQPHSPNLEADIRGAVMAAQGIETVPETEASILKVVNEKRYLFRDMCHFMRFVSLLEPPIMPYVFVCPGVAQTNPEWLTANFEILVLKLA